MGVVKQQEPWDPPVGIAMPAFGGTVQITQIHGGIAITQGMLSDNPIKLTHNEIEPFIEALREVML